MVCWCAQVVRELKQTAYRPKMAVLVRQARQQHGQQRTSSCSSSDVLEAQAPHEGVVPKLYIGYWHFANEPQQSSVSPASTPPHASICTGPMHAAAQQPYHSLVSFSKGAVLTCAGLAASLLHQQVGHPHRQH
jgi:hypothetical protein